MMTWNHRMVNCPSENDGDDLLMFKEVFYDENDVPYAYSDMYLCGESREEMVELAERLLKAAQQEVLHENQFGEGGVQ